LLLLSIIYTINLPVVRPRSCRVIYYFDTPALGRRHQSFGRVKRHHILVSLLMVGGVILSCESSTRYKHA